MTRTEARDHIKNNFLESYVQQITTKARTGGYICPLCHSGEGKNHSGAFSITPNKTSWKCFSCDKGGDVFDLIGEYEQISGFNERLERAANLFNITVDSYTPSKKSNQSQAPRPQPSVPAPTAPAAPADFTAYYETCRERLKNSPAAINYLANRGISLETAIFYGLGFDDKADPANAPAGLFPIKYPEPRIIIPFDNAHYLGRAINKNAKFDKVNSKQIGGGRAYLFNGNALYSSTEPLFVCEGAFNALSIIEAGGQAIATNSVANTDYFLELIKQNRPNRPIIIAYDNDAAGKNSLDRLQAGLNNLKIDFYTAIPPAPHNDVNDILRESRDALDVYMSDAIRAAQQPAEERRREYYETNSTAGHIQAFMDNIKKSSRAPVYETGFENLDKALDGGLYSGLYFIGAVSSLGKTTFCLQIADNLAKAGHDVLIFSLEMARAELMSKSISRETYIINTAQGGDQRNAKTTRGIMTGKKYSLYSTAERQLIEAAISEYGTYSTHIFIFEGVGNIGAAEIRKETEKHIRITGKKPIVIIDYLQIMSPADARSTDKQNTDKGVLELKRTSRDLDLPIIGISSFNRDNYKEPVNLASFKESGSIEYSSDVLIGLQYLGMDYMEGEGGEKDKKRAERIRKLLKENEEKGKKGEPQQVQVKILKNRNGSKGEAILDFIPMFNYFSESTATSEQVKQEIRQTELDQLKAAYSNAANENGEALLSDMAKKMGTRPNTIKNKLGKYEEFNIDGNTVTLTET